MYIQHPLYPAGYRQIQLTEFVSNIIPPLDAVRVTIQPTGQDIRFRDDSIDPTVTTGIHVENDSTYVLDSATRSLRVISEANTTPPVVADANLASGPVNSDLSFVSIDTGPEWNGYHFAIVEDAVVGVNSTATLNSAAVNSDVTFTADTQDPVWDGYTFTTVLDATVGANAVAVLLSGPVNSDLTFTAATKEDSWNAYNFTTVADANAGVNSTAVLLSAAVNSDITFTSVTKDDAWDGANFETVADANAGANATATLACVAVNADLTFTAVAKGDEWNDYDFEIVVDAVAGANATAILLSAAVNSDLTFTAVAKGDEWSDYNFTTVADANAGANATATLDINAANGNLVFTSPTKSDTHDGVSFTASSNGAELVTYAAGTFTLEFNTTVSNGSTMKATFDAAIGANPGWPQWTCAIEGDGSGAWVTADDDNETIVSAGGVTPIAEEILFAGNTFTVHIFSANTAADVITLWAGGPANCANWAVTDEGDGSGIVDAGTIKSAGGIDEVIPWIDFAANTFTIHTLVATTANDVEILWAGGPANCANWAIAADGDGSGAVDAGTDTSAGGIDVVAPYVSYAGVTFTIHTLATTVASEVVTIWGTGPAECANWGIADEGDGSGVVDVNTATSAGGVDVVDPYIEYTAPNTFTIHTFAANTASDVVALWALGPANCANFAIAAEGDGTGAVDATTIASAGGIDVLVPFINFAANTFTIHAYAAAIGSDIVTLWAGGPAECANWAVVDEGDGSGAVQAVTDTSAGGAIPVATSLDFSAHTFTFHTYPAVTTANDAAVLWAGGPAECADWTITEEGDGTGVVAAATDTSANGADAVGAVLNLLWHKEL
jgi:hypothetical protein